jgi:CRISPR-associated protein Cmr2
MSFDPGGETDAKKELKAELAKNLPGFGHNDLMGQLGLADIADGAIAKLPEGAALLRFRFTLAKRYVSRDDAVFFPTDNPLRREHVFKVPMIAAATWKGSLRAAAVERLIVGGSADQIGDRIALRELFGDEKAEDEEGSSDGGESQHKLRAFIDRQASATKKAFGERCPVDQHKRGRLIFFPSWFKKTVLDVLNPRDKAKRTGTVPISLEAVPSGEESSFTLLYLPFDLLGKPAEIAGAQRRDWKLTGEALAQMLLKTGFGAKKSSGCGRIGPILKDFRFECKSGGFRRLELTRALQLSELGSAFAEAAG